MVLHVEVGEAIAALAAAESAEATENAGVGAMTATGGSAPLGAARLELQYFSKNLN